MPTIRLMREVAEPEGNGPTNGMCALQRLLRARGPEWLRVGGELQEGEIPWWWCWLDRRKVIECDRQGRAFVLGPCFLFHDPDDACAIEAEKVACESQYCLMHFTESEWYRKLIQNHLGENALAPVEIWPLPIDPLPPPPLKPTTDVLVYVKSGASDFLVDKLKTSWPAVRVLRYGGHRREELWEAARRSRVCLYLSASDRGPLGLAEILLCGCPAVGTERGAPWIEPGINGARVTALVAGRLIEAVDAVLSQRYAAEEIRDRALVRFDGSMSLRVICNSLAPFASVPG